MSVKSNFQIEMINPSAWPRNTLKTQARKIASPQRRSSRLGSGSLPLVEVEGQLHAVSAGERAKEKAEPGTQIASRLSLVRMFITALCQIKNPSAHMNTRTGPSDRI